MFLKIMSSESKPDHDMTKTYRLFDRVESVEFAREGGKASADVFFVNGDTERFALDGNCYVMNDAGDTVAKFGPA